MRALRDTTLLMSLDDCKRFQALSKLYSELSSIAEITEEQRASADPKDIQACLHTGVLPACYENTNIQIEIQRQSEVSCFIRHEDGTVTCPMGKTLCFQGEKKYGKVYGSKEAAAPVPTAVRMERRLRRSRSALRRLMFR